MLPALGAALLLLIAFLTTSGDLTGETSTQVVVSWIDVALMVAGGGALGTLIVTRRGGGGTLSCGLFAAVALLTALSIAWSVAPDQSWEESGRTVAYVSVFVVAVVGARLKRSSATALMAITLAALGLCVWTLAVKALDLNLYGQPGYGRLVGPFGYWNTTGLCGALALPGLVWCSARRERTPLVRGLATAGIAAAATVVALSYSRSAVAAGVVAALLPLLAIRSRRRAVVMLALGVAGAVPIWIYALIDHNVAADGAGSVYGSSGPPLHRSGAELMLGLIILAVLALLTAAGAGLSRYLDTVAQPARRIAWFDRGMAGAVGAVPVLVIVWLLVNSRGPFGEISHLWNSFTSTKGGVGDGITRVTSVSSSRSIYWRQALSVGEHHLLAGAGAGTFYPAHLRYGTALLSPEGGDAKHAHSYIFDTFASFGLIGVVLNLGLLLAWGRDAWGAVTQRSGLTTGGPAAAELDARWALIGVVVAFGVSSALDYTWYFPGVTIPALLAAGWIAGLAPSERRAATRTAQTTETARTPRPRPLAARPGAILAITVLAVVTLAIAWESLQPMRSVQSWHASLNNLDGAHPNGSVALADARAAVSEDPLSSDALDQLASVYGALGDSKREESTLVKANRLQLGNPQPSAALGRYLLCSGQYAAALDPLFGAIDLDRTDTDNQQEMLNAAAAHQRPAALCEGLG